MRLRNRYIFHFEKLARGYHYNSPEDAGKWRYCGSFRAATQAEALLKAKFAVGSSLVRVIPEENCDKGYL